MNVSITPLTSTLINIRLLMNLKGTTIVLFVREWNPDACCADKEQVSIKKQKFNSNLFFIGFYGTKY